MERRVVWLFLGALVLHNLEEAIWLPAWSQHAQRWHPPVHAASFRFALVVFTALAFVVTWAADRRGGAWLYAAAALWVVMLLNVLLPHLLATIFLRSYAAGLATALAFILPVDVYLLWRGLKERWLKAGWLALASLGGAGVVLGGLSGLLWVGDRLFGGA